MKLESKGLDDQLQDEEGVFRFLKDLQEAIFDYQVCSWLGTPPNVNKDNR